eukprot:g28574.t1
MAGSRPPDVALKIGSWSCFCFCGSPDVRSELEQFEYLERSPSELERPCSLNEDLQEFEDNERPNFSGEWTLVKAPAEILERRWTKDDYTTFILHAKKKWQKALHLLNQACDASLWPKLMAFNSVINVCGKAKQWRMAISVFSDLHFFSVCLTRLQPDVISFSAAIAACEKSQQWQSALKLFEQLLDESLQLDIVACNSAVSACEKGSQWQAAFGVLYDVQKIDLQLS